MHQWCGCILKPRPNYSSFARETYFVGKNVDHLTHDTMFIAAAVSCYGLVTWSKPFHIHNFLLFMLYSSARKVFHHQISFQLISWTSLACTGREFSFCFFISYSYISTCMTWRHLEGILSSKTGNITWTEMGKQNVQLSWEVNAMSLVRPLFCSNSAMNLFSYVLKDPFTMSGSKILLTSFLQHYV